MQTRLNNGKIVRWNSYEVDGFDKAVLKEKAMSDEEWKSYQKELKELKDFSVFGLWFFGTMLAVCCIVAAYQIVNRLLG